jgi:hypothetical protein
MTTLREILALARSGSPDRAWAAFLAAGWAQRYDDPDALTLKGRLLKDQARRAVPDARSAFYRSAGAAYAAAAALAPATYPLINAATLALLGGNPAEAKALAARTLDLLDRGAHEPETPYWLAATRAEALLLLDRHAAAAEALTAAIQRAPRAWEDHAATLGQFALILGHQRADAAWLDHHRPPPSLYLQGIMALSPDDGGTAARIDAIVAEERVGFAFGALAAGADILIAEAVVRRGGSLHVVLPCPASEFRAQSVVVIDEDWGARFDALIEAADVVEALEDSPGPGSAAIAIAERMAMGLAIRNARLLHSRTLAVSVIDHAGAERIPAAWALAGGRARSIIVERTRPVPATPPDDIAGPAALIALANRATAPAPLAGLLWTATAGATSLLAFGSPDDALAAARAMADRIGHAPALGLDFGLGWNGQCDPALSARAATLAAAAEDGQWLASRPMALALELCPERPIMETAGEVRGPSGIHPIFSVGVTRSPAAAGF